LRLQLPWIRRCAGQRKGDDRGGGRAGEGRLGQQFMRELRARMATRPLRLANGGPWVLLAAPGAVHRLVDGLVSLILVACQHEKAHCLRGKYA
jgi:hypothetical protein